MEATQILKEFQESAAHLDRNTRVSECENSIKFLEAKVKKIEMILKDIPARYVMPVDNKKKLNELTCGKCKNLEEKLASMTKRHRLQQEHYEGRAENSVNIKRAHYSIMEADMVEHKFLLKRIVGVYGNKALVDMLNHCENPNISELTDERIAQYMKVKPHL